LAALLEQLASRIQTGEPIDMEAVARDHPEHADQLRELLPAMALLANLSKSDAPLHPRSAELGTLGDFQLVREIGRGGMGIVYEARQLSLNRSVALKVLPFAATMDPRHLQRFKHEAMAAAMLHHPHIVPVYGVGCERGVHYYAMQLIEGSSLAAVVEEMKPENNERPADVTADYAPTAHPDTPKPDTIPVAALTTEKTKSKKDRAYFRTTVERIAQAADAIEYAHSMGVVHRDVKPANLLLDDAGHLWVTDFGLAKLDTAVNMTISGDLIGTLRYMSPEQALARHGLVDHRTDVYSLGATLYELLTLRHVFDGKDKHEILKQIAFEEPVVLRKVDRMIPAELETIALKALEKNPNERYTTAGEMAEDLRRWLGGHPITARRIGPLSRVARWMQRNRVVTSLLGMIIVVTILGFVGVLLQWRAAVDQGTLAKKNADRAVEKEQDAKQQRDDALALSDQLRATVYASQMNLAQHALESGGIGLVAHFLDLHTPRPGQSDLRGFEWYHLDRLCRPECLTLNSPDHDIDSLVFSPDGNRLASASKDKVIRIWDTHTGRELVKWKTDAFYSIAFSHNGQLLLSIQKDKNVLSTNNKLIVWNATNGQELLTIELTDMSVNGICAAFSPDGLRIATASNDGTVRLRDASSGKISDTLQTGKPKIGVGWGYSAIVFSPSGKYIACATSVGTQVWDILAKIVVLSLEERVGDNFASDDNIAFTPDERRVTISSNGIGIVYDVVSGREISKMVAFIKPSQFNYTALSPNGAYIARRYDREVLVWDVHKNSICTTYRVHAPVYRMCFSSDGQYLAGAAADNTIKIWRVPGENNPFVIKGPVGKTQGLCFSSDGTRVASATEDGIIKIWDSWSGREILGFQGHTGDGKTTIAQLGGVMFSPDDKLLVSSAWDGTVKLWDAKTGALYKTLSKHALPARSVTFSPDGTRVASASATQIIVSDVKTGKEVFSIHVPRDSSGRANSVYGVSYSSDGKRLVTGYVNEHPMQIWDAETGQELVTLRHKGAIMRGIFSPDGTSVAGASSDHTIVICDAATGAIKTTMYGHTNGVTRLVYSPDGRRIASIQWYGPMKLWDTKTGLELLTLKTYHGVVFSPDGNRLASIKDDGSICIWDGTPRIRNIALP
jgi:WD40 repeat protein/serine/threonine protein kinase